VIYYRQVVSKKTISNIDENKIENGRKKTK
jgi:hypothetical protein